MDIVERLRSKKMERVGAGRTGREAAAEIERLRAECCDKALAWDKCQEHLKRAEAAERERDRLRKAAQNLANYYAKSVNVGPGPHPAREALLWASLRQALAEDSDG